MLSSPEELDDQTQRLSKRRRIKTKSYDHEFLDNEEQLMLQQALKVSRLETKRIEIDIPEAPVFYPNLKEFEDPIAYIQSIHDQVSPYGICKIIPPVEWNPICQVSVDNKNTFPTKRQQINTLQEGQGFDDGDRYNLMEYKAMADSFYKKWCETHHLEQYKEHLIVNNKDLAKDYWDIVETNKDKIQVDYANDLDTTVYTSGFIKKNDLNKIKTEEEKNISQDNATSNNNSSCTNSKTTTNNNSIFNEDYYIQSSWNLNNLPTAKGSVLQYLQTPINGINVPWLYIGMLFSSFCWHNEDNYFYSINYNHYGAAKQWYGIPGSSAEHFEKVSKNYLLGLFRESPDLLHHMTTQISPSLLSKNGVPVYKSTQEPKSFIVTFPKSFHAGFSYGFNVGEAVNFACSDWLLLGSEAEERYRSFARESVFSHQRLLFTLLHHRNEMDRKSLHDLAHEVIRVLNEELTSRSIIYKQGVRDLTKIVTLPCNNFTCIDNKAAEFDDMRICCVCKQICIFSAIACECDRNKVACIRHYPLMCKCTNQKKFLLEWASNDGLQKIKSEAMKMK